MADPKLVHAIRALSGDELRELLERAVPGAEELHKNLEATFSLRVTEEEMGNRTERTNPPIHTTTEEWEAVKAALLAGTNDAGKAVLKRMLAMEGKKP